MRFRALNLQKYGCFTDRSLRFRPDARAHVVFGPNEAGKSTALAATRDLLFGFPERVTIDFLHKSSDLRVGGELVARDGRRLSLARRKGRARTLLSPEGGELPDDALIPFLGGLTRDVFSRAFGLDAGALRAGADEILKNRGDAGESLMAAAAGLRGLAELRKNLDTEADAIFTPRARQRKFYEAEARHAAARKALREGELTAGAWRKLQEDIAARAARMEEIKARRAEVATRLRAIDRLTRLKPRVAAIDSAETALAGLVAAGDPPRGFGAELGKALGDVSSAESLQAEARARVEKATSELASIEVDRALIARGTEIAALHRDLGAYRKAVSDRPRVQAEADGYQAEALEIAASLGLADIGELEARRPTAAALADIAALIREGEKLDGELRGLEDAIARERDGLDKLDREDAARGGLVDPAPLREKQAVFRDVPERARDHDREAARLAGDLRALDDEAARLSPPVGDLDRMARMAPPTAEALQGFRAAFEEADVEARATRAALASAREEAASVSARLQALAAGRPVPTPERIAAARGARDDAWAVLRRALFGDGAAPTGAALASAVSRYEVAAAEADALADEAARDADRVSRHRAAEEDLARRNEQIHAAEQRLSTTEARAADLSRRWADAWAPTGVAPTTPGEMAGWLAALRALLERRAALTTRRANLEALAADLARLAPPLEALSLEAGLPPLPGLDVGRMAARVEERLRSLEAPWTAARDLQTRRADAQPRLEGLRANHEAAIARRAGWLTRWARVAPVLGLRPEDSREAAGAALEAWRSAPTPLANRADRLRRVDGMKRDMERFEAGVTGLVEELAPELAAASPMDAVETLHKRLTAAAALEGRREQLARQRGELELALTAAGDALAAARAHRDALAERAPPGADLSLLRQRLDARDRAAEALDIARREFAIAADGLDETVVRADLASFDPDRAGAEADAAQREEKLLAEEENRVYAEHDALTKNRDALGEGDAAERAMQARRGAEAEMVALAREWSILRIGSLLLETTLEKHRASRADPLLSRAGALLRSLTGGAYAAIEQQYDDADDARLVARRASGESVPVEGLSEGARDQFYLALRLAYVEDYGARAEPAPFIVDDIFASFDDARTRYALETLATLGEGAQPIVFTHHRHVVDIAVAALGATVDVIELA